MAKKNLLQSLLSVSGMTLISRVFGFIRDMLQATYFGATPLTDAFNVAYKLPNLLRRIFAEGAFSQAFVPVLAEYKNLRTHQETREFVASVMGVLASVLLLVTIIGIIFAGLVIVITAPGFSADPYKLKMAILMLRITFPFILLISLASMIGGVLNTWGMFSIPAFTSTILNFSFIIFILFLRHYFHPEILALAYATLVGGVLQLLFQLPYLKKCNMLVWPKFNFKNSAVIRVVKLMGPAIFAVSIAQISLVINTIYASFLPNGSITWLYFADRLMEFPTGVLGVALGTILLPTLSRHASNKNKDFFSKSLDWGIRLCLLLALPATVGLGLLAKPLTMTLFMHGKFTYYDAIMTSYALITYSVGLLGLILVKVLAPGFYANQDIKTPVKIAIFVLICTQLMNLVFIGPLKHAGLTLSIGLSACINALLLARMLIKKGLYLPGVGWKSFFIRLAFAVILMALAIIISLYFLKPWFLLGLPYKVGGLALIILIAAAVYIASLLLIGFRLRDFIHTEE